MLHGYLRGVRILSLFFFSRIQREKVSVISLAEIDMCIEEVFGCSPAEVTSRVSVIDSVIHLCKHV